MCVGGCRFGNPPISNSKSTPSHSFFPVVHAPHDRALSLSAASCFANNRPKIQLTVPPMSESLKDRLKARALALQVEAQSSLESARQKAASIDVSKIKERAAALAETARSRLEAPSTEGGPDPGCESGSDADSEQRSLVSGARDRLNSGLSQLPSLGYFGSRLGQLGEAGKSGLSQGMDGARQAKTRGAEGLRTAVAAGSSGVGRIKEGAKGAGGWPSGSRSQRGRDPVRHHA